MANLLDTLHQYSTPELIGATAQNLGESENAVAKAMGGFAVTIFAGLLDKSRKASLNASIFNNLKNFDASILEKLQSLVGSGNLAHHDPRDVSGQLLGTLFGQKVPAITNSVAAFSQMKQSSASALLGISGPMVMGVLSQRITADNLDQAGWVALLQQEENNILNMLPPGVGSLLSLPSFNTGAALVNTGYGEAVAGQRWWLTLVWLLGFGVAIAYFMKNCTF